MNEYNKNLNVTFEHKNLLITVGAFLAGLALGAGAFALMGGGNSVLGPGLEKNESANYEKIKEVVRQQYPEYFDGTRFSYFGTVEEVRDGSILVRTNVPEIVLLTSDIKELQEIRVDENTQIIKRVQKNDEEYLQEVREYEAAFAEYQRQVQALPGVGDLDPEFNIQEPAYPSIEREEPISLSEINTGDYARINVFDSTDSQNIVASYIGIDASVDAGMAGDAEAI